MSEWKEYKLGEIILLIGGGTPKTSVPEYWNGDIPWLSVSDFNDGKKYVYDAEKRISQLGLDNSSTKILHKDDIIISARGTVGIMAMIGRDMAFNQSCYGIRNKDLVDKHYLYYLVVNSVNGLKQNAYGGVFDTITRETFDLIDISLPPLDKQKRIASILSSLDDKIDLLNRENATLEAMAETLFRQWFIEEAKEDWEEGKLGDICNYVTEKIDIGNVEIGDYISTENMCSNKQGVVQASSVPETGKATKYHIDDILLSNIRPYFKKIWLADKEGGCSADVLCFRSKNELCKFYTYYTIRQDEFFDYVMLGSKGCKMPRGDKSHIMNWPIMIPPKETLLDFNKIVVSGIEKIRSNNKQIQNLIHTRNRLLPKLMSNEIQL